LLLNEAAKGGNCSVAPIWTGATDPGYRIKIPMHLKTKRSKEMKDHG